MQRIMFMAGSILASSFGFALAGLALRHAARNSRRERADTHSRIPLLARMTLPAAAWATAVRGYDSPEVAREDRLTRKKYAGMVRSAR